MKGYKITLLTVTVSLFFSFSPRGFTSEEGVTFEFVKIANIGDSLGLISIDGNEVAYQKESSGQIYVGDGVSEERVTVGYPEVYFSAYGGPSYSNGVVAFKAVIKWQQSYYQAIFTAKDGILEPQEIEPLIGGSFFGDPSCYNGDLSYRFVSTTPEVWSGIVVLEVALAELTSVALSFDDIPEGSGKFTAFSDPSFAEHWVTFVGYGREWIQSEQQGVYRANIADGTLQRIADQQTNIPGKDEKFALFEIIDVTGKTVRVPPAVDASGNVAFIGSNTFLHEGIYKFTNGRISKVVDRDTRIPGLTEVFTWLTGISIDKGFVVFTGSGANNLLTGVYTDLGGSLAKVIQPSDILDGKIVMAAKTYYNESISGNNIAFTVKFHDGSRAVYIARASGDMGPTTPDCSTDAIIIGDTQYTTNTNNESQLSITANGAITVNSSVSVVYHAPSITLKPGFHAVSGSQFTAKSMSVSCTNAPSSARAAGAASLIQDETLSSKTLAKEPDTSVAPIASWLNPADLPTSLQ